MQTCPLSHMEEGLLFHCLTLIFRVAVRAPASNILATNAQHQRVCFSSTHWFFFSWSIDLASLILITNQTENRTLFQWLIALCDTSPDFPSKSDGAFILDAAKKNNSPNPPSLAEDVFSPSEESCGRLNVPSYLLSSQATLAAINEAGQ